MIKLYYENIFITDFVASHKVNIDSLLEQIDFNEQAFCEEHSLDGIDYDLFRIELH